MKAGLVRLIGGTSIFAAAVPIFSTNPGARRRFNLALATGIALAGATPGLAQASAILTVPDAIYSTSAQVTEPNGFVHSESTNLPTPGVGIVGGNPNYQPPQTWIAQVATNYQIPSITTGVTVDTGTQGVAGSNLTYYVAFSGPDGFVPIEIKAGGSAALATFAVAEGTPAPTLEDNRAAAFLHITEASDQTQEVVQLYAESNFDDSPGEHLFSLDQVFMLQANTVYEVDMYATVFAAYGRTGSAFVDPNFIAPAGYSVITSAGIGNAAAVTPIPAALPLFTSGIGALGVLGWRKRKKALTA